VVESFIITNTETTKTAQTPLDSASSKVSSPSAALSLHTHSDIELSIAASKCSNYTKSATTSTASDNQPGNADQYEIAQRRLTSKEEKHEASTSLNSEEMYVNNCKYTSVNTTEQIEEIVDDNQMSDLTSISSQNDDDENISLAHASPEGDMEPKSQYLTLGTAKQRRVSLQKSEGGNKTMDVQHDQYEEYVVNDQCIPFIEMSIDNNANMEDDDCKSIHHQTVKLHKIQKHAERKKKNEERKRKKDKFDINSFHLKKMRSLSPNNSGDSGDDDQSSGSDHIFVRIGIQNNIC